MSFVSTRGKDVAGDAVKTRMPPDDRSTDQSNSGHNAGLVQFGRKRYKVSAVYKNSPSVVDRRKA